MDSDQYDHEENIDDWLVSGADFEWNHVGDQVEEGSSCTGYVHDRVTKSDKPDNNSAEKMCPFQYSQSHNLNHTTVKSATSGLTMHLLEESEFPSTTKLPADQLYSWLRSTKTIQTVFGINSLSLTCD